MLTISGGISFNSVTPAASELSFAQQQAVEKMPFSLRELIRRDVVTAQWALGLSENRQSSLGNQHLCDLLNDEVIEPSDIASRFDATHLFILEDHASVRALLREKMITAEQMAALNDRQLFMLLSSEFEQTLRNPAHQQKLKAGELTLDELIQQHRAGVRSDTVSSPAMRPRKVTRSEWHLPSSMDANGKVVTVGWPKPTAQHFLLLDSVAPIRDLMSAGLLSRAEARNLDQSEIVTIEECPAICQLVADKVISSEQLVALRFDQLRELTRPEVQQKVRDREWTITGGRLVATARYTARGALSYASGSYLSRQKAAAGAGSTKLRDDGSTAFCLNPNVLAAIKDILRCGEDLDTIAIIFDNALRHGYLDELGEIVSSCNKNLLSWTDNADAIESLISKLEERGLQLNVKSNGVVELSELAMGPVDQTVLQESRQVLDTFLPQSVNKTIVARYLQGQSFEMALSRRYAKETNVLKQFPLALKYLKQAFNEGIIDSVYINDQVNYFSLNGFHQVLLTQHKIPVLKDLVNNHKGILLWFSSTMLRHLTNEPNPCHLIKRGELSWTELLEIDAIIRIRRIREDLQQIFNSADKTVAWLSKYRLRSQHDEDRLISPGYTGVDFDSLHPSLKELTGGSAGKQVVLRHERGSTAGAGMGHKSRYAIFSVEEQHRFGLDDEQLRQLNAKLPIQRFVLRALLTAELCTPAFAVKCPPFFCMTLSKPHFLNLVLSQVISLEDVTRQFSDDHFRCLESHPSVCQLLADRIISGGAFTRLTSTQLAKLDKEEVQLKLRSADTFDTESSSIDSVLNQF